MTVKTTWKRDNDGNSLFLYLGRCLVGKVVRKGFKEKGSDRPEYGWRWDFLLSQPNDCGVDWSAADAQSTLEELLLDWLIEAEVEHEDEPEPIALPIVLEVVEGLPEKAPHSAPSTPFRPRVPAGTRLTMTGNGTAMVPPPAETWEVFKARKDAEEAAKTSVKTARRKTGTVRKQA